jgi:hypothetical protein
VASAEAGGRGSRGPRIGFLPRAFLLAAGALPLATCSYEVLLGTVTSYRLSAVDCGTWDSLEVHTTGEYFVGHSAARPNDTMSYFVFDLSPVAGKKVTAASIAIPGTSDWKITVAEPDAGSFFKLGTTPLPAGTTLAQVTVGGPNSTVYDDVRAEQDLGFEWVPSGSTVNTYDAFHYDGSRLQAAVNLGGLYPLFAVDRFTETAPTEEYLYGGGLCGPDVVLIVSTE